MMAWIGLNNAEEKNIDRIINIISKEKYTEIYIFEINDFRFLSVSASVKNNLGYSAIEIYQLTLMDIEPEYPIEKFKTLILPLLKKEKERIIFETKHQRKDGSLYPVEVQLQFAKHKNITVFVAVCVDLTRTKEVEHALQLKDEQYRLVTDSIPVFITYVDTKLRYKFVNFTYEKWFDIPREKILGQRLDETVSSKEFEYLKPNIEMALSGKQVSFEYAFKHESHNGRVYSVVYEPDLDEHGNVNGIYMLGSDITERVHFETELKDANEKTNLILESIGEGVYGLDTNGNTTFINRMASKLIGWNAEELIGKPQHATIHHSYAFFSFHFSFLKIDVLLFYCA